MSEAIFKNEFNSYLGKGENREREGKIFSVFLLLPEPNPIKLTKPTVL